mmetsp:Transcript_45641/g.72193  ORF Transcript_45641/g.72193 Transcript_45641/m.72193 type:complete len:1015 (-) Transcript_45641:273-3317(-)
MPTYVLQGVPIEFPYDAYDCQLAYMEHVVRALSAGENALLESPTGTGKTLCLLCATLGWRRHQGQAIAAARTSWEAQSDPNTPSMANSCPRIWYSSRTHSQIKQVIRELKRTTYKPSSVVLGSREHFCVHAIVSKHTGSRQNAMCRRARDDNKCSFFVGLRKQGSKVNTSCMDIEEITSTCKSHQVCPFYKTREDAKDVELLFIPYDYLINPMTRDSLQVTLKNSILIFDEGHNIEKSCESVASFELSTIDVAHAIEELEDAFWALDNNLDAAEVLKDLSPNEMMNHINLFKKNLLALQDSILAETLQKDAATNRTMLKERGSKILQILERGNDQYDGVTAKDLKRIVYCIRNVIYVLAAHNQNLQSGQLYLEKLQDMFVAVFRASPEELDKHYQVLLYEDDGEKRGTKRKSVDFNSAVSSDKSGQSRTLCLWCFSCSVALQNLQQQGIRSLIITSGTLSPLDGAIEDFGIPFPIVLENKHVIDSRRQLWGGVVPCGPGGCSLDATYGARDNPEYLKDLGQTVARYAACVPDGILLAFQSYAQKEAVLRSWRDSGVFEEIQKHKPVFEEAPNNFEMTRMMTRFNDAIVQAPTPLRPTGGALLVAVCRGKLCEGIDFTDRQCRLVIMVGIPYPQKQDLRVMLKQDFLDARGGQGHGKSWYVREAIRAVNQTVGRVIRHSGDFGAVLLCDHRYANGNRIASLTTRLPSWLRSELSVLSDFEAAVSSCRRFFNSHGSRIPAQRLHVSDDAVNGHVAAATGGDVSSGIGASTANSTHGTLQQPKQTATTSSAAPKHSSSSASSGAQRSQNAGLHFSALGAFLKQQRAARDASQDGQAPQNATPRAGNKTAPVKISVANPQVLAPSTQVQSRSATSDMKSSDVGNLGKSVAGRTPRNFVPQPKWVGLDKWLQAAENLVPSMEFDAMKENLTLMQKYAELIMDSTQVGCDIEQSLQASIRSVANAVLPAFNFDSDAEKQQRNKLVKDFASLIPGLVRSLWRKGVDDLLSSQGKAAFAWKA